jgi:hypothetical protein
MDVTLSFIQMNMYSVGKKYGENIRVKNIIEGNLFGYRKTYKWRTGTNRRKKS